ncbi:hypothetical protein V2G26_005982 [Clonostachys chloroleuca]
MRDAQVSGAERDEQNNRKQKHKIKGSENKGISTKKCDFVAQARMGVAAQAATNTRFGGDLCTSCYSQRALSLSLRRPSTTLYRHSPRVRLMVCIVFTLCQALAARFGGSMVQHHRNQSAASRTPRLHHITSRQEDGADSLMRIAS